MQVRALFGAVALVVSVIALPGTPALADDESPGADAAASVAPADASPSKNVDTPSPSPSALPAPAAPAAPSTTAAPAAPTSTAAPAAPTTTATATPTPAAPTTTATATASPTASPTATPTPPAGRPRLRERQRLELTVDRDHDGRADQGDAFRVVVTVTNSGAVPLRRLHVVDALVKRSGRAVNCAATALAPGASTTCTSGPVRVTHTQAKAGTVRNTARAAAQTATGQLVQSAASTARIAVQRPSAAGHKHHKHKHHKHKHHKHKHHKHRHHAHRHHVRVPLAKLSMTQYVLRVIDTNKNGRLQKGDSVRFGFRVTNVGSESLAGLQIVDRRLSRFHLTVSCAGTSLTPGASTTCSSEALKITPFQDKNDKLGRNFAYATAATANGTPARSNATVITLVRSTVRLSRLPDTGAPVVEGELWAMGGLLLGGALLIGLGLRRRPVLLTGPTAQRPSSSG